MPQAYGQVHQHRVFMNDRHRKGFEGATIMDTEQRLNSIECALAEMEKMLDELNIEFIRQSKLLDKIQKENKELRESLENNVKSLSEETRPPHY